MAGFKKFGDHCMSKFLTDCIETLLGRSSLNVDVLNTYLSCGLVYSLQSYVPLLLGCLMTFSNNFGLTHQTVLIVAIG